MPALYTSLRPDTAVKEANQAGTLQPTLLVSYRADCDSILDLTDPATLATLPLTAADLATNSWRDAMTGGREAPTQTLARTLHQAGTNGIIVPSYTRGAKPSDLNLVLWAWPSLTVIDDENRLTPAPA